MSNIKGILIEEQPREKLIKLGPNSLTEVELLAILLRIGTRDKNVIELSREILQTFDIQNMSRKTYSELLSFKGIKKAKATQIVATFELARRLSSNTLPKKIPITKSEEIYNMVKDDFLFLKIEKTMVVYTDTKNHIIKKEFLFEGGLDYSLIDQKILIKNVLLNDASGIFLLHNHPSGDSTPSSEDKSITQKLKFSCETLGIRFLDHIIIGDNYYSFFDNDLL